MSFATEPMDVPDHVDLEHGQALVAVRCRRCNSWVVLYHFLLRKDPDALRVHVEAHQGCSVVR